MAFPEDDIHIADSGDVTSIRAQAIADIWSGAGYPSGGVDTIDSDVDPDTLISGIAGVLRADTYTTNVTDGTVDEDVVSWMFIPYISNGRLYVHGLGHSNLATAGQKEVIELALSRGNVVLVQLMPPGNTSGHDDLGDQDDPGTFSALEYFLTPAVKALNQAITDYSPTRIVMGGLSGGGWLTTLIAALDERIDVSLPVAGSLPFDIRDAGIVADFGDWEQRLNNITYDGAGQLDYLDLYIMGTSNSRKQVLVGNSEDPVCFWDDDPDTVTFPDGRYATFVTEVASAATAISGDWSNVIATNTSHSINTATRTGVFEPELGDELEITVPVAAYSLSAAIVPGYSGPIVRLREDSGSTEQDFKFASGVLVTDDVNQDTVAEWLTANSASNAYIRTLYDQSDSDYHLHQATTSRQPKLVANTDSGGQWAADFERDDQQYLESDSGPDPGEPLTVAAWILSESVVTGGLLFVGQSGNEAGLITLGGSTSIAALSQDVSNSQATATGYLSTSEWRHSLGEFSAGDSRRIVIDGTERGTDTNSRTVGSASTPKIRMSYRFHSGASTQYGDGLIDSAVVFAAVLTAGEIAGWSSSRGYTYGDDPPTGSGPRLGHRVIGIA